jgi:tetratricopeptide (TPR) repeat protein
MKCAAEFRRGAVLIVLATLIAFLPALRAGFVWDDEALHDNPLIRSAGGLVDLWLHPSKNTFETHYWPLTYTTFWLEHKAWGFAPFGYHLTNVLLHALNAVLLGLLLRRLRAPGALLAAAIFALHPVHVESTAWVIERKDTLSTALYLSAFLAYWAFAQGGDRRWAVLAGAFFIGAMLSKSMAGSWPLGVALVLWWKRDRLTVRGLAPLAPFVVLAVALAALDVGLSRQRATQAVFDFSVPERLLLAGRAVWFYAAKLVWPANLVTIYPQWKIDAGAPGQWAFPAMAVFAVVVLWRMRESWGKAPVAAVLFYIVTLGPVLGLVYFGYMQHSFVADRFQYLAAAGPIALFAGVSTRLAGRFSPATARAAAVLLLVVLAALTFHQAGFYRNDETLFGHNIEVNPKSATAHNNLGFALHNRREFERAVANYREALRLNPDYADAHTNLGVAYGMLRRNDEAVDCLREAARLRPDLAPTRNKLGKALAQRGDYAEAECCFTEAMRLQPDYTEARENLARLQRVRVTEEGR